MVERLCATVADERAGVGLEMVMFLEPILLLCTRAQLGVRAKVGVARLRARLGVRAGLGVARLGV